MKIQLIGGKRGGQLIATGDNPLPFIQMAHPVEREAFLMTHENAKPEARDIKCDSYRLQELRRGRFSETVYVLEGLDEEQALALWSGCHL